MPSAPAHRGPTIGALVRLGVGIDYALFIVNRHLKGLMSGLEVGDSIVRSLTTSGRAVLFAKLTAPMTVLAAVTLLPALLGLLGLRVLSRKQRRQLARGGP